MRGGIVESLHRGAVAVVDVEGRLRYYIGDPDLVTFLRSSAKPWQALAVVESGAADWFGLTEREIAVVTGSHGGEPFHIEAVRSILSKIGLDEGALACGVHPPLHEETARRMREAGEEPTALHSNCSGKHAGMLATARFLDHPIEGYRDPKHPVQQTILSVIADLADLNPSQIVIGVDGCGVPTFAMSLRHAALAMARLVDPHGFASERAEACHRIVRAMQRHPEMVGGTDRLDTDLIRVGCGRLISKGGAEAYQVVGLLPNALGAGSPALGIALKIEDGNHRARTPAVVEVLRQMGVLGEAELEALARYRRADVKNEHGEVVGEVRTVADFGLRIAE